MWGIFFGEFQCLPVDDCSAVSCDSGALARGSEHMSLHHLEPVSTKLLELRKTLVFSNSFYPSDEKDEQVFKTLFTKTNNSKCKFHRTF